MAFPQLGKGDVTAEFGFVLDVDAEVDDRLDVPSEEAAVEAVFGDAQPHGAPQLVGGFVDGDLVAEPPQVVGGGHPRRSAADDADALGSVDGGRGRDVQPLPVRGVGRFGPVLLGDEPFEGTDGDRFVDLASPAGVFAGGGAHPAAH